MISSLKLWHICLALFIFSFGVRIVDIKSVGETWDEVAVANNGATYIQLISKGDFSSQSWSLNKEHPPVAKYIYGATKVLPRISQRVADWDSEYLPGKKFTAGRILSIILGSIAAVVVLLLGKELYDLRVGVVAGLIFALLPPVVAHSKIIGLETPLLLWILLSVYFFVRRRVYLTGIFFGLSLATRFNALLFAPFFLFALAPMNSWKVGWREHLKTLLKIAVSAGIVLILSWPWLWSNPVGQLWGSLMQSNDLIGQKEYFLGVKRAAPIYYYLAYFLTTTPTIILLLLAPFLIKLFRNRTRADMIIIIYFLSPFLASFFRLKQDGLRYIFHFYPALSIAAAVGLFYLMRKIRGKIKLREIWVIGGILVVSLVYSNYSVHPYYLDYYNGLVGGVENVYAKRLFEVGWWGEGIRGAVMWVNENADPGSTVNLTFSPRHVAPILRGDLEMLAGTIDGKYVIYDTYNDWYEEIYVSEGDYEVVYQEKVGDVPLVTVYKKRDAKID